MIPYRAPVLGYQRVYSKADSRIDRRLFRFSLALFCLVAVGLFYIWTHVQVVSVGYRIHALEKMQEELMRERKALLVEIALLKSPERLESIATTQLGLQTPKPQQFVYFKIQPEQGLARSDAAQY